MSEKNIRCLVLELFAGFLMISGMIGAVGLKIADQIYDLHYRGFFNLITFSLIMFFVGLGLGIKALVDIYAVVNAYNEKKVRKMNLYK